MFRGDTRAMVVFRLAVRRVGFMAGLIRVPDGDDRMGADATCALFEGSE